MPYHVLNNPIKSDAIAMPHSFEDVKMIASIGKGTALEKGDVLQSHVSEDEMHRRLNSFIGKKRTQANYKNIKDFIPSIKEEDIFKDQQSDTCARVRMEFVKRKSSKGFFRVKVVHNTWGPQTATPQTAQKRPIQETNDDSSLSPAIIERVKSLENTLSVKPVTPDIYKRLKQLENRIAHLESMSPEYQEFWKHAKGVKVALDITYNSTTINKQLDMMKRKRVD